MPLPHDATVQSALMQLLATHGLDGGARLYREAMRDSLVPTAAPGVYRLAANATPVEAVVDVYGQGHLVQAESVGPGLAFLESAMPDWQETMELRTMRARGSGSPAGQRIEVEIRLQDVLDQGGLIYPVESVTVGRAWYCTLPAGTIEAREVR